jgi:hypothetical protein
MGPSLRSTLTYSSFTKCEHCPTRRAKRVTERDIYITRCYYFGRLFDEERSLALRGQNFSGCI